MYAKIALLAAVLAVTPIAHAAETVAALARETGLTERNVCMVVGTRSSYAEYRSNFTRVDRQFREAVGDVRYQRLTGRKVTPIKLDSADQTRVVQRKKQTKSEATSL